jgi:hypothetical protein
LAPSDDKTDAIIVVAIAVFGGRSLMFWHVPLERDHLVDSMMSVIGIYRQSTRGPVLNGVSDTDSSDNLGQPQVTSSDAPMCAILAKNTTKVLLSSEQC